MNDVLSRVVAATRRSLVAVDNERGVAKRSAEDLAESRDHRFLRAITDPARTVRLIAEIKSASPSAGSIIENPDVESIAWSYRAGGASAISVVTEPEFFRGSRMWIGRASEASGLPILMKEFVIDEIQVDLGVARGAEGILLIAAIVEMQRLRELIARVDELGCDALVEVHDENELEKALEAGAKIIGVNNRNLRDFSVDLGTSERLSQMMPGNMTRVAESGIRSRSDVDRLLDVGFHALLVGESILRQDDLVGAVRNLVA